jgi:hypothetical protein
MGNTRGKVKDKDGWKEGERERETESIEGEFSVLFAAACVFFSVRHSSECSIQSIQKKKKHARY